MKNIIISNKFLLKRIKKNFKKNGAESIHILSDFDRTITRAFFKRESIPSLLSILRNGDFLTKDYAKKAHELYNKYHLIEINYKIPFSKRKALMEEWWRKRFALLIASGLNRKDIEKAVLSEKLVLRKGAIKFFNILKKNNIPLVFLSSSGIGEDSTSFYLKRKNLCYNNIHIISNSFVYDKKGRAIKVKEPIIHGFNKDETAIKKHPVFKKIKNRKNILLLGDSLADVLMVKGFGYNNIIRIGFLSENVKRDLKYYKEAYDIVAINDSTLGFVNELLEKVL